MSLVRLINNNTYSRHEGIITTWRIISTTTNSAGTAVINSKDLKLVEAGLDPFYGIGLTMSSSDIFDPTKWKGKSHLGDILVAIRASLIDFFFFFFFFFIYINENTHIIDREQFQTIY